MAHLKWQLIVSIKHYLFFRLESRLPSESIHLAMETIEIVLGQHCKYDQGKKPVNKTVSFTLIKEEGLCCFSVADSLLSSCMWWLQDIWPLNHWVPSPEHQRSHKQNNQWSISLLYWRPCTELWHQQTAWSWSKMHFNIPGSCQNTTKSLDGKTSMSEKPHIAQARSSCLYGGAWVWEMQEGL